MRKVLQPLKNKKTVVSGRVKNVIYKNKLDKHHTSKLNVKILLKDVIINGVEIDHIWLLERNKYYKPYHKAINKRVKFKGKVEPYLKEDGIVYKEDYGIKRESKMYLEDEYNELFKKWYIDLV